NTANIMTTLSSIVNDLQSGSSANMSTDLGKFDTAFAVFQTNAGQVGAQYQQMQAMQQQTTYTQQSLNTQLGAIQNVDVASVSTQYQQALSNYQVALYATAQLGQQPSLATYLH
ncbi:flagellar hook-associated protein 3, partial [mine drainage metagenome]